MRNRRSYAAFGAPALVAAPVRMIVVDDAVVVLELYLLGMSNLTVGLIVIGTVLTMVWS